MFCSSPKGPNLGDYIDSGKFTKSGSERYFSFDLELLEIFFLNMLLKLCLTVTWLSSLFLEDENELLLIIRYYLISIVFPSSSLMLFVFLVCLWYNDSACWIEEIDNPSVSNNLPFDYE